MTETHITLPRSAWSSEEISLALEDVNLRIWGPESSPILEISSIGREDFDVGMTFLGESKFRELVAVVEHRLVVAKARSAP